MATYRPSQKLQSRAKAINQQSAYINRLALVILGARAAVDSYKQEIPKSQLGRIRMRMGYRPDENALKATAMEYFCVVRVPDDKFQFWRLAPRVPAWIKLQTGQKATSLPGPRE